MPQNLAPQMDPIPLPSASPVDVQTADPRLNQGREAEMPPVYWGGKTGSAAYMANKVLTGWLAGTKIANERKQKKMADEVGAAKTGLDYIGQSYRAALDSGDQKKIEETKSALNEAWNDYLNKAEKYALPDEQVDPKTGKAKKPGIGQRLKEGFTGGEAPHLNLAKSTIAILRKTDPTQVYQPTSEDQIRKQMMQQQLEEGKQNISLGKQQMEINDETLKEKKEVRQAKDDYIAAVKSGNRKAQDEAGQTIETLTGKKVDPAYKQELERKVAESATGALDKMQKGASFESLSDDEQAALVASGLAVQAKNPMQAYLKQVGPGKKFATEYAAAHQYMLDERTSRVMGQKPTALEDLRMSEEVILQHDLQDPVKAKKYGVEPLKPGDKPPRWLVEQQAEKRYRATVEEKSDVKVYSDIAQQRVINNALRTFSPLEQAQIKAMFLSTDDELGTTTLNPSPNIGKMDKNKARQLYQSFRSRVENWARKMYPGVDDDTLDEVLGQVPEGMDYDVTPPPGPSAPPSDRKIEPPPPPASGGQKTYKVKGPKGYLYGGQAVELTADEVKKLKNHPGYTLEDYYSGGGGASAQR